MKPTHPSYEEKGCSCWISFHVCIVAVAAIVLTDTFIVPLGSLPLLSIPLSFWSTSWGVGTEVQRQHGRVVQNCYFPLGEEGL